MQADEGAASFPWPLAPGRAERALHLPEQLWHRFAGSKHPKRVVWAGWRGDGSVPKQRMREEGSLVAMGSWQGLVWQGRVESAGCCVPWPWGSPGWGGGPLATWVKHEGNRGQEISWSLAWLKTVREPRKGFLPGLGGFAPAPSPRGEHVERGESHPSSEHPPRRGHRVGQGQPHGRPRCPPQGSSAGHASPLLVPAHPGQRDPSTHLLPNLQPQHLQPMAQSQHPSLRAPTTYPPTPGSQGSMGRQRG